MEVVLHGAALVFEYRQVGANEVLSGEGAAVDDGGFAHQSMGAAQSSLPIWSR